MAKRRSEAALLAPVAGPMRLAGLISVAAGLIWLFQAAAIAWLIAGWLEGETALSRAVTAAAIYLGLALVRAMLERAAGGLAFDAADRTIARLRNDLLARQASAPSPTHSAAFAALIAEKLPLIQPWLTRYRIAMAKVMVLPFVYLAVAFSQSWAVGIIFLVAGPLIPVFMALVGMAAEGASRRQMRQLGSLNDLLQEEIGALTDTRLLGAVPAMARRFEAASDGLRIRSMKVLAVAFLSSTVLELFAALGVAMVAVYVGFSLLGAIDFGAFGELSFFSGLLLLLMAPDYFQPLRELASAWHDRASGLAVMAEIEAETGAERRPMIGEGRPAQPLAGSLSIVMRGAVAALGEHDLPLPDLTVRGGEAVALVGPSGSGKSTLLSVLCGLTALSDGRLSVCGRPLDAKSADGWRSRIALIPQSPHFGEETLREWLDPRRTGADPWPALRAASIAPVVEALAEGLETHLGETGGGLSGGEARRLLVARAMMMGGDLVLADEPTADLDPATAAAVLEGLNRLRRGGRTILAATHDPAVMAAMDRLVRTDGEMEAVA